MAPYRNPLVNIRTGMVTKNTEIGERLIREDGRLNWTLPKKTDWKFRLWDERGGKCYNKHVYSVKHNENQNLCLILEIRSSIFVTSRIRSKIPSGLEIIMIPDNYRLQNPCLF